MNNITAKPFGAAEHCAMDNWAAEYAKKLFISEAAQRTADITAEAQTREAADNEIRDDFTAADNHLRTYLINEDNEIRLDFTYADAELDEKKLDKTQYASTSQAGVIKLLSSGSGENRSGLVVSPTDGTAYVNTKNGVARDGAGGISTVAATEEEIYAGTDAYKPIVPQTLKCAVESITGKSNLLTTVSSNIVAAINELDSGIDLLEDITGRITDLKTSTKESLVAAINELYSEYKDKMTGKYSEKPVRTGTWTDGMPVWRVSIPLTSVEDIGCTNPMEMWRTDCTRILEKLGIIKSDENVIYLDDKLVFQCNNRYDMEAFALNVSLSGSGRYSFSEDDGDYASHFYGWIEFAAAESNIL